MQHPLNIIHHYPCRWDLNISLGLVCKSYINSLLLDKHWSRINCIYPSIIYIKTSITFRLEKFVVK
jgi:hypothetical protein